MLVERYKIKDVYSDISLPSANIAPFVTKQIEQFGSGICFEDGLTGESYSFTQLIDKVHTRPPCLHSAIDICHPVSVNTEGNTSHCPSLCSIMYIIGSED